MRSCHFLGKVPLALALPRYELSPVLSAHIPFLYMQHVCTFTFATQEAYFAPKSLRLNSNGLLLHKSSKLP